MAKGLIGRHLNDSSPVFNTEGVWQRPQRETLWNDYCSWQVDDKSHSLSLSVNLCIQCKQMYACCVWVCVRQNMHCVNAWVCLCLHEFIRMCERACDMAGRHEYKPYGVSYSEPPQSSEDLHQTDYSSTTMTASNGRNKTPFNEHANLRNITLCSEV